MRGSQMQVCVTNLCLLLSSFNLHLMCLRMHAIETTSRAIGDTMKKVIGVCFFNNGGYNHVFELLSADTTMIFLIKWGTTEILHKFQ